MSFFFALFFMVLVFWRPQEWLAPVLYGIPILYGVVAMSSLTFLAEYSTNRITLPKGPFVFLVIGFFVAALTSFVVQAYWDGLVWTFEDLWKLTFFAILLYCVTDRPSRLRAIAIVFVVMTSIMAVHALMQQKLGYGFAFQYPMLQLRPESDEYIARSLFFGIFEDPNDLAQILATAIPFAFAMTKRQSVLSFSLGVGVTALLVSGILATYSRGGQIALVVVGCVLVILLLPRKWMLFVLFLLAVGALAVCPFSGPYLDSSGSDRVSFWGEANLIFKTRPVFGVGYRMINDFISDDRAIHNAFVLCYSELGLFGYWFWFTIILSGIIGSWHTRVVLRLSSSEDGQYVARFAGLAIAATCGFLASGYFLTRAYVYPLVFLFVVLAAVPQIGQPMVPDQTRDLTLKGWRLVLYGTIGTVVSISYIYISILLLNKAVK